MAEKMAEKGHVWKESWVTTQGGGNRHSFAR